MKQIQYLSPTSIQMFYARNEEFYLQYLAMDRPAREPQTPPMSIGSAFDAYAKSWLHAALFGAGKDPRFELRTLFEAQVEPQHRTWAWEHGRYAFNIYQQSGALSDLLLELQGAIGEPKFEFEVKGVISGYRDGVTMTREGITLLGKPDVFFINRLGAHVILDWKVNGYCSVYGVSPMKGYVRLRDMGQNMGQHKDAHLISYNGVMINAAESLEWLNEDWATQLSIYGWLCGEEIGSDFIVAIDQLACRPNGAYPKIWVAEHRLKVSPDFQWKAFARAQHVWEVSHSDHFFRGLSLEDSKARCSLLDRQAEALRGVGSEEDDTFRKLTRGF